MADQKLFPSIRDIAEQTEALPEHVKGSAEEPAKEDDDERAVQVIESLCMSCREQGQTRMLLTSIPYFREVIIMSFRCEHCGFENNEIQSAGSIRPEGTVYTARILARSDLDRQVVKSATCTVTLPEYELTIPPSKGQLTTVEGIVRDIVRDLSLDQPLRRIQEPETYAKIQTLVDKLKLILADNGDDEDEWDGEGKAKGSVEGGELGKKDLLKAAQKDAPMPMFTIKLDDPSGNSFIEFVQSMSDPKWNLRTYHRTKEQNIALGLVAADQAPEDGDGKQLQSVAEGAEGEGEGEEGIGGGADGQNEEIFVFKGICSSCGHDLDTLMKKVSIPYFKDILIMSTNCDRCGYRDNEVKSGAAISELGKKITLKVEDREDLSRDILKSESCGLSIPEIDLVLQPGTLGGRFTTLEGILDQVYEELSTKVFETGEFSNLSVPDGGDSSVRDAAGHTTFEGFLRALKEVKSAERPFTLILDDPLANSYLQNIYAPDEDPNMESVVYERTWQQNEELGLNDMKVEGYEEDAKEDVKEGKTEETKEGEKTEERKA
ncbi:zf-ZPR1-domain-containing protein [Stereum hirsutum FP-91666 SS1]|uniref:zf-ZPR1-domain-containing protein n=1 Tax=Stereum hirsutum (strain FP-91666) TaxID=721885 RepID=UPI000440BCFB|nr:zf-ZPR1-domain-containing protein [Stereum hirsutum FP-91666 SS1]EIM86612.1 zf-ZPR1-domain-containing protein [Stereum hirsutum FP-91666 SS1]